MGPELCRIRRLLLSAVAGAGLLLVAQPGLAAPSGRLREADVRAFMAEVESASQARDVARIGALMANDCVVVFTSGDPHDAKVVELGKPIYLDSLRDGYSSLPALKSYRYETSDQRVHLSQDGRQAIVDTEVTESLEFNDRHIVTRSHETSIVELRDGHLALVRVAATVTGKSTQ